jgi:hypothetical protein
MKEINFSQALEELKSGNTVTNAAWPSNTYIYLVPANRYPAHRNIKKTMVNEFVNDLVPYTSYIALKNDADEVTPWNSTHVDLLSDTWYVC